MPFFLIAKIICNESRVNNQECAHAVWSIKNTLESLYIRAIDTVEYRRCDSEFPIRRISRKTKIEQDIWTKHKSYKERKKECNSSWNQYELHVVSWSFREKARTMKEDTERDQKLEVISSSIQESCFPRRKKCDYNHHGDISNEEEIEHMPLDFFSRKKVSI